MLTDHSMQAPLTGFMDEAGTFYPSMKSVQEYLPAGRTVVPAADPHREERERRLLNTPVGPIPSAQRKDEVLSKVYDLKYIKLVQGCKFLAGFIARTRAGIFVVEGDFNREICLEAVAEAKAQGLASCRMFVYGRTATYSGSKICFVKFEDIGV